MSKVVGLLLITAMAIGSVGCAMEATDASGDDGTPTAKQTNRGELAAKNLANERQMLPVPPELTIPTDRVGWQDVALNEGAPIRVKTPIPDRNPSPR